MTSVEEARETMDEHGKLPFLTLEVFKDESLPLLPRNLAEHELLNLSTLPHIQHVCVTMRTRLESNRKQFCIALDLQHRLHGHCSDLAKVV